jgi:hypothetical protein
MNYEQVKRHIGLDALPFKVVKHFPEHYVGGDKATLFCVTEPRGIRVWKKVWTNYDNGMFSVISLLLPCGAQFLVHSNHKKARADIAIAEGNGNSDHQWDFKYKAGEFVIPVNDFEVSDRLCASGIHFYFDKIDAEQHYM